MRKIKTEAFKKTSHGDRQQSLWQQGDVTMVTRRSHHGNRKIQHVDDSFRVYKPNAAK